MPARIGTVELPRLSPGLLAVRQAVRRVAEEHRDELAGGCIVGLSGGADSLALLAAARAEGLDAEAVVVDHGLQENSDRVAAEAAEVARRLGAPARVRAVEVSSGPDAGGIENAARDARHRALAQVAAGRPVLLAHTLDDQAETVLLGMGRGSGAASLSGMATWGRGPAGAVVGRPLLSVRRADTVGACRELGLEPWQDPANSDPRYRRVRVRAELLPLAEEILGGGVSGALARTAELARMDNDALEQMAERELTRLQGETTDPAVLSCPGLAGLAPAVRARALRRWLSARGAGPLTHAHLSAVDKLVTAWAGQGPVAVPAHPGSGVRMAGCGNRLVVARDHGNLTVFAEPR